MKRFILLSLSLLLYTVQLSASPPRILHYSETSGYNHGTADESHAMLFLISQDHGWEVVDDPSGTRFANLDSLNGFEVVVFANTSGDGLLSATERANFEAYIAGGGSYLGIHAASDTYRHSSANGGSKGKWDWYAENVAGCSVQQNPNHTSSNHTNTITAVATHQIIDSMQAALPWVKTEEYYYWQNGYRSPLFTELLRVGQTGSNSQDAPRMVAHYRELPGGGRSFYTSLGHAASNYTSNQTFIRLIESALVWIIEKPGAFWIDLSPPESLLPPEIHDGYFQLDEVPDIRRYAVYDFHGRELATGEVPDSGLLPVLSGEGIYLYKTHSRIWLHGVKN